MKRLGLLGIAILILMMPTACKNGFPFDHKPTVPPPPPNPLAVTITISGYSYPGAVTIRPGGTVCWENPSSSFSDHTVQVDDGAGGCQSDNVVSIGGSVCISFPTAGTFEYHCSYHGFCGANCNSCAGMFGLVRAQ